ncbi:MAG: hypothetical protein ACC628_24965 [Pirellulaceae bacterium]
MALQQVEHVRGQSERLDRGVVEGFQAGGLFALGDGPGEDFLGDTVAADGVAEGS